MLLYNEFSSIWIYPVKCLFDNFVVLFEEAQGNNSYEKGRRKIGNFENKKFIASAFLGYLLCHGYWHEEKSSIKS